MDQQLLELTDGDVALAAMIQKLHGEQTRAWLDRHIPALDFLTPRQCLTGTIELKRRLCVCLMRSSRWLM